MGFHPRCFDTAELRVVAALQIEQMSSVINDGDDHFPFVCPCFRLGSGSHALGIFQCEDGLAHRCFHVRPYAFSKANTLSRMLSTLPVPET
jgi:hypothetical protein